MNVLDYNGYVIEAAPYQPEGNEKWTVNINIRKQTGGSVTQSNFSASNAVVDKKMAIEQCYRFGKQIIDGKIKNVSFGSMVLASNVLLK